VCNLLSVEILHCVQNDIQGNFRLRHSSFKALAFTAESGSLSMMRRNPPPPAFPVSVRSALAPARPDEYANRAGVRYFGSLFSTMKQRAAVLYQFRNIKNKSAAEKIYRDEARSRIDAASGWYCVCTKILLVIN
jgi:hypothetical protein